VSYHAFPSFVGVATPIAVLALVATERLPFALGPSS